MSSLQSGVTVGDDAITGTLKYVTGYTGYSSVTEDQEGNYLAIKVDFKDGAECSAMLGEKGPVDLTTDKFLIARITDKTEVLKITATIGDVSTVKTYDLSGLTLEESGG